MISLSSDAVGFVGKFYEIPKTEIIVQIKFALIKTKSNSQSNLLKSSLSPADLMVTHGLGECKLLLQNKGLRLGIR